MGTVSKEHFTYLYSPARDRALTTRNIRARWTKAGLFPFNPDKALCDIRKPPAVCIAPKAYEVICPSTSSSHDTSCDDIDSVSGGCVALSLAGTSGTRVP